MVKLFYFRAFISDIPEVIALAEKIWIPSFSRYFEEEELQSLFEGMYNHKKLADTLTNRNYEFYFANTEEGEHKGYFAIEMTEKTLKLDKIYVDPTNQRQGLGKLIFRHITELAYQKEAEMISLNVNRRNNSAIRFYKKIGFEIIRSVDIPGPNGFIYDDYVMEMPL